VPPGRYEIGYGRSVPSSRSTPKTRAVTPDLSGGDANGFRRRNVRGNSGRSLTNDRRSSVLQQLEELFLSEGFADSTVEALVTRLRCSKSTLYGIAPSRDEIIVVVVKQFFREAAQRIEAAVGEIADPRDRIASYLAGVGSQMGRMSERCYSDMVSYAITRDIYDHNSRVAAGRVNSMIQEGIAVGAFRQLHAEFVGQAISLLIEGIQEGTLLRRTGLTSGEAYQELSGLVLASLTNYGSPQ
jgi:AcrR family transcriptional regulator